MSDDPILSTASEDAPVPESDADVLEDEPRNLILALISQLRIGVDLSRITLPTFILEPRSMLEKLTDFMAHGEFLNTVPKTEDPVDRMIAIVKWYLSGFYIRPQGVKKPYNPILGEIFRCKWQFEQTESLTQYVAEQVSHHPPISALYGSNRKEGYVISGSLHPRSKFLGTSAASILEGEAAVTFIGLDGEEYTITFPSFYARGILFGTLLMEMCGTVNINCAKTGLKTEIEFKAKPFWGGEYNVISGKIKNKASETLYNINGKWDSVINIVSSKTKVSSVLWDPKGAKRIPMIVRPLSEQEQHESQRLWSAVTDAIKKKDQKIATDEKTKLEEEQRAGVKQRKESGIVWVPKLFYTRDGGKTWHYRFANNSPYDASEGVEDEKDGIIYPINKGLQYIIDNAAGESGMASNSGTSSKSNSNEEIEEEDENN